MDAILKNHKVIVCTGSGGVGKTTMSAALSILAAQRGLNVLVLTIDPARRLATALGTDAAQGEVRVPAQHYQGQLYAEMIDPQKIFEDFIRRLAPSEEIVQGVLQNGLYQQLSTTLSGSQEFTSLVKLYECVNSCKYDLVILDTPPAEHAIDFLQAPDKMAALFQAKVVRWFISKPEHQPLLTRLMNRGTRTLINTLELLTGAGFITELRNFFQSLRMLVDDISDTSRRAHELLLSSDTAFVLMTSLDQAKMHESEEFCQELNQSGYRLRSVIVNRAYPQWFLGERRQTDNEVRDVASAELLALYQDMTTFFERRSEFYDEFRAPDGAALNIIKIPEMDEDVYGLPALERIAKYIATV